MYFTLHHLLVSSLKFFIPGNLGGNPATTTSASEKRVLISLSKTMYSEVILFTVSSSLARSLPPMSDDCL